MGTDKPAFNSEQLSRLEELLSGYAVAPHVMGEVSEGRDEPIESVPLRQCEQCGVFETQGLPLESIGNKQKVLVCDTCREKLWECPICEEIKERPDNDYLCKECR